MKSNIKLSVVIPCFNEEKYIEKLINDLIQIVEPYEIIIVDDSSNDKSVNIIKSINDSIITLIQNKSNEGKGSCIKKGIQQCKGDVVLIQDADPEYSPKDIHMIIEPFSDPKTNFVIGTRFQTKYKRKIGYSDNS